MILPEFPARLGSVEAAPPWSVYVQTVQLCDVPLSCVPHSMNRKLPQGESGSADSYTHLTLPTIYSV